MEPLVLTAKVVYREDGYVAALEPLGLSGAGDSVTRAQDQLVETLRGWIESHEAAETLGQALSDAGFPGLEEDTEIQLEFAE